MTLCTQLPPDNRENQDMTTPTDVWMWDAEAGEVVAQDMNYTRGGEAIPVDFSDEPPGLLAAAAPDMARDLVHVLEQFGYELPYVVTERIRASLRKAGVMP